MMNELEENKTRDLGDLAVEPPSPEAPTGRYLVVAIGIDRYTHCPSLDNAVSDAKAIVELLKQCGFEEIARAPSLYDEQATRDAISSLATEQLTTEDVLRPEDSLVFFYAGHGEKIETAVPDPFDPSKSQVSRTGYLLPVDAEPGKPGKWIKLDSFLEDLSRLRARHVLVILDACKSGIALHSKFKGRGSPVPASVAEQRLWPSRRVITSAMHNQVAQDGGGRFGNHSLFTEALIEAVQNRQADKDGDGFIPSIDLFSYVQKRVADQAKEIYRAKQKPDCGRLPGDGGGDLVISLREGAFNRLIEQSLEAMLNYDVSRLDELVLKLDAANAGHPLTCYLQFRRKFMQGNLDGAEQAVSDFPDSDFDDTSLPIYRGDLKVLCKQLAYWRPLLEIPIGAPPIELQMLSGPDAHSLHFLQASPFRSGVLYEVENGSIAQFRVKNIGATPAHLYYLDVGPNGQLLPPLPLLEGVAAIEGLAPGATGVGAVWKIEGIPSAITETRVFYSPRRIWELLLQKKHTNTRTATSRDRRDRRCADEGHLQKDRRSSSV